MPNSSSADKFKRINVLVREDQYDQVSQSGLNMSGLIRDLLDDHFSNEKIVFAVSGKAKSIYQNIISNFGAEDKELEAYFLYALDRYLEDKTKQIESLRKTIKA